MGSLSLTNDVVTGGRAGVSVDVATDAIFNHLRSLGYSSRCSE